MMAFMASSSMPALMFHMMNGVLLVTVGVLIVAGCLTTSERSLTYTTVLALMGILLAFGSGLAFLFARQDAYSLGMALGFLLAMTMEVCALALAWRGGATSVPRPVMPGPA